MTFTGGEHVRLKPTKDKKYPSIGTVVGVEGERVEVEYRFGYTERSRETRMHSAARLEEMCKESVYRGYGSSECGRPAKEDHLCGMHLGYRKRREAERLKRESDQRASEERTARMLKKNAELLRVIDREGLGDIVKIYDTESGLVTIKLDDLINLIGE